MKGAILFHKLVYQFFRPLFPMIRKHKFVYITKQPVLKTNAIYAVNHSCKYDIQYVNEILCKQAYFLAGKQSMCFSDRICAFLLGTLWVDRKSKPEKKQVVKKIIDLLNKGADFVIFPEGTWNLTPSKPMLPLYWGIIDIARKSGKPIIPLVLEYTSDKCYVAFGKPMTINATDKKSVKSQELNDKFATMKWKIWERFQDTGYDTLEEWNKEVSYRLATYSKLDIKYETSVIRKEFDNIEVVFKHLSFIQPNIHNAFLFNKRNHD